jgi:hypothetical protein
MPATADRVACIQRGQFRVQRLARVPLIVRYSLARVPRLVKQPLDLLKVDRLTQMRLTLTAVPTERRMEDMASFSRPEEHAAMQTLPRGPARLERLSHLASPLRTPRAPRERTPQNVTHPAVFSWRDFEILTFPPWQQGHGQIGGNYARDHQDAVQCLGGRRA